jgi:hypothetical protein
MIFTLKDSYVQLQSSYQMDILLTIAYSFRNGFLYTSDLVDYVFHGQTQVGEHFGDVIKWKVFQAAHYGTQQLYESSHLKGTWSMSLSI